ncbi:hypothetical protein [Streptomyces fragilis]|uniref:hypothetical protein n=1 Tax=Streptomyces fragilis TaxID=67301 RepID=UPI0024DE5E8F|nr:hypothetical protein [Streptomyces fragilis]
MPAPPGERGDLGVSPWGEPGGGRGAGRIGAGPGAAAGDRPAARVGFGRARRPETAPDGPGSPGQLRTGPGAQATSGRAREPGTALVSYTHLDVYKRQAPDGPGSPGHLRTCLLYTSRCV